MSPSQNPVRFNLHDLKSNIVKRVGPDKANQYFKHFRNFISCKLRKPELDKLVILTIGKENVALHNQLIKAVLSNAIRCELPPPPPSFQDTSKPVKGIRRKPLTPSVSNDEGSPQNPTSPAPSVWANGDSFAMSPKKGRSGIRDRKANKERSSLLGPQGRGETTDGLVTKSGANGVFGSLDLSRPLRESHGAAEEPDRELNDAGMPPLKRLKSLANSEVPVVDFKEEDRLCNVEMNEDDQEEFLRRGSCPISAPLGIPFTPGSVGSARKSPFVAMPRHLTHLLLLDGTETEFLDTSDLPDVQTIQKQMDQIAVVEGLQGASRECGSLLSQALEVFLMRLVKASVDLANSRSCKEEDHATGSDSGLLWGKEFKKDLLLPAAKVHHGRNGVCPGHLISTGGTGEVVQNERETSQRCVSLLDFKVAMELNPQQLGEDWPLQLEKISFRLFEH
eukprot:c24769_g1_i1 orf=258-1604(-)